MDLLSSWCGVEWSIETPHAAAVAAAPTSVDTYS